MEQSKSKRGRSRETRANNNARSHEKDPTTPSKTKRASLTSSSKSKDKMLRSKSSSKASPLVGKKRTMLKARSTPDIQLITPSGSSKRKESKKRSGSENATLLTKKKSSKKAGSFRPYNIPIMHQLSSTPIPKPASTLHQALSRISVASFMEKNGNGLHGIPVMKVSHNHPGQQHRRILTLSADHCSLLLTHGGFLRKSKSKTIDVADVLDWHQGVVATKPLEEYCKSLQHQNDKKKNGENRGSVAGCIPFIVTIIYRNATTGRRDSLDLLVENQDFRRALVATLALLKKTYMEVTPLIGNETLLMRYLWKDIDSNNDNKVNEREFLTLCHRHHFYARDDAAKQFRLFCKDHQVKRNELSYRDCMRLLQMLKGRTPAMDAWKAVFGTASTVSAPALLESFLHGPQKESKTCDLQDAVDLIATMNATELDNHDTNGSASSNTKKLTRPQFEEFLRSSLNDCYDPVKRLPTRPLTKPISHYWINASYNTYLMGGEKDPSSGLSSSSIEAYTRALARGCKYIELDCWDGPILADGEYEPMVYHQNPRAGQRGSKKDNKTNVGEDGDECLHHDSTKISFRSVVSVIANFLKANPTSYPIILGLENHCSHPYQKAMAKLMKSAFGSKLFVPTSVHRTKELPSPEELVGHVVVKGKKSQSLNDSTEPGSRMKSVSGSDPYSSLFKMFDAPIKPESKLIQTYLPDQTILASPLQGKKKRKGGVGLGAGPGLFDKREDGDGMPKYTDELLSLTLFFDAEFSGFFEESMDFLPSHNHSLCSSRVAKVAAKYETNPKLWREFNQTHCKFTDLVRCPQNPCRFSTFQLVNIIVNIASSDPDLSWWK